MKQVQWCGCILFKRKENEVLLVKTKGLEKGKWGLPAGHLEPSEQSEQGSGTTAGEHSKRGSSKSYETPLEGAKREAEEETGLKIELTEKDFVNTYDGELKANDGTILKGKYHIYATEKFSGTLKTSELDAKWFHIEDILKGTETSFVLHGTEYILKPLNKEAIRDFLKKRGIPINI